MRYRPDIDGLRAVAVLPVVAFHYELNRVAPGGFIGVDIFFVISGFLITRIIYDGVAAGTYSVAEFYERRIRRIFPALFVMFAAVLAVSFFVYLPYELTDVGGSVLSSVFFVSNLLFQASGGYFDQNLQTNPVLHTWSLSVEEQFYVLFPILVLLIQRFRRETQLGILIAVALLSFVVSVVETITAPTAAFYLTQSRAWELLLGGLVSLGVFPALKQRWAAETLGWLGLAGLVLPIFLYSSSTPFPGIAALPPCLGTAAILYIGLHHRTVVARLLEAPPVRFIGLVSYSLYLWHWPLFVLYTSYYFPDRLTKLCLIAVAIGLATASWWFVERPFRTAPYRFTRRGTLAFGMTAMLTTAGIAMILAPMDFRYFPVSQVATRSVEYEHYRPERAMRVGTCFLTSEFNSFSAYQPDTCLRLDATRHNVLILGDSHAAHLWLGYQTAFPDINFLQATASGCKPVDDPSGPSRCTDLIKYILDQYLPAHHVDAVILSARWDASDVHAAIATAGGLRRYADRVIISGPIEEYDQAPPRLVARAEIAGEDAGRLGMIHLRPEPRITDRLFAATQLPEGVQYVSVFDALCTPECRLTVGDGVPLQFDYYGHLTEQGAIYLAQRVGPLFLNSLSSAASRATPG